MYYQNIPSSPVPTIVLDIRSIFPIFLPIWLKVTISIFFFFTWQNLRARKIECISEILVYFKLLHFLNFCWCKSFFVDASFDLTAFCISSYSFFLKCFSSKPSFWSILWFYRNILPFPFNSKKNILVWSTNCQQSFGHSFLL